jgi:hypothetical protein
MVASPIIFYGVLDRWDKTKFIKRFLIIVLAAFMAILVSFLVLSFQIMYSSGSPQGASSYLIDIFNRRIFNIDPNLPDVYEQASRASLWSILKIYLEESYFDKLYVPYFVIAIVFAIMSFIYWITNRIKPLNPTQTSKAMALIVTTWVSLLSPLSWYIIFKSVAYFHTHMNYLPWHMPFTLFGFGMCGYIVEILFQQRNARQPYHANSPVSNC